MLIVPILLASTLVIETSVRESVVDHIKVRAIGFGVGPASFTFVSFDACPPAGQSEEEEAAPTGAKFVVSVRATHPCSRAFLSRLRETVPRTFDSWRHDEQTSQASGFDCGASTDTIQGPSESRSIVLKEEAREKPDCFAVEVSRKADGQVTALMLLLPMAVGHKDLADQVEEYLRAAEPKLSKVKVFLVPTNMIDVKVARGLTTQKAYAEGLGFGIVRSFRNSRRFGIGDFGFWRMPGRPDITGFQFGRRLVAALPVPVDGLFVRRIRWPSDSQVMFFPTYSGEANHRRESSDDLGQAMEAVWTSARRQNAAVDWRNRDIMWAKVDQKTLATWKIKTFGGQVLGFTGKFGPALQLLDGGTVELSPPDSVGKTTISIWIKPTIRSGGPHKRRACLRSPIASGAGVSLEIMEDCQIQIGANSKDRVELDLELWNHVALLGGGSRPQVFVNGVQYFMSKASAGSKGWKIGGDGGSLQVSDLAVWNRGLSRQEVDDVRKGTLRGDQLIGPIPFDGIPCCDRDRDLPPPD